MSKSLKKDIEYSLLNKNTKYPVNIHFIHNKNVLENMQIVKAKLTICNEVSRSLWDYNNIEEIQIAKLKAKAAQNLLNLIYRDINDFLPYLSKTLLEEIELSDIDKQLVHDRLEQLYAIVDGR